MDGEEEMPTDTEYLMRIALLRHSVIRASTFASGSSSQIRPGPSSSSRTWFKMLRPTTPEIEARALCDAQ